MRWFRQRTGLGTALSLLAMALQLALTLGHTHAGELSGHASVAAAVQTLHETAPDAAAPSGQDHGPGSLCPDCLLIAQIAAGLTAAPPALPIPVLSHGTSAIACVHGACAVQIRTGFKPRAPPRS